MASLFSLPSPRRLGTVDADCRVNSEAESMRRVSASAERSRPAVRVPISVVGQCARQCGVVLLARACESLQFDSSVRGFREQ